MKKGITKALAMFCATAMIVSVFSFSVFADEVDEEQNEQNNGHLFVGLRLLHLAAVVIECGIGRQFLEQLCIDAVVVVVELPLVQSQRCYGVLVADSKQDVIVKLQAVVQPDNLRRCQRCIAQQAERVCAVGFLLMVIGIKVATTRVGEVDGTPVGPVDIREIGGVGVCTGSGEVWRYF